MGKFNIKVCRCARKSLKITCDALKNVFTSAIECAKMYENYINKLKNDKPQTKNTICSRFELDTS